MQLTTANHTSKTTLSKPRANPTRGLLWKLSFSLSHLNITSLGTDYVLNEKECGIACVNIPPCFSFNLAALYDTNGRDLCELLSSNKYNNEDKFIGSLTKG